MSFPRKQESRICRGRSCTCPNDGQPQELLLKFKIEKSNPYKQGYEVTDSKKKSDLKKDKVNYYKEIIAREKEAIRERHLNGATGREIVESLCRLSDRIITELYEFASKSYSEDPSKHSKCVIAAVGGYGRGSLSPFSDIDVMFLYQNRVDEFIQTVSEDIFHILWDLGFDLGHSCRSVGDCLKLAENDFKT